VLCASHVVDPIMFNFSFLSDLFRRYKILSIMFSKQFCEIVKLLELMFFIFMVSSFVWVFYSTVGN
jgi:hypothetical protein